MPEQTVHKMGEKDFKVSWESMKTHCKSVWRRYGSSGGRCEWRSLFFLPPIVGELGESKDGTHRSECTLWPQKTLSTNSLRYPFRKWNPCSKLYSPSFVSSCMRHVSMSGHWNFFLHWLRMVFYSSKGLCRQQGQLVGLVQTAGMDIYR